MIPKPPSWIKESTIICPKRVKFEVLVTIRPVTHTAEVAVKRASIKARFPLKVPGSSNAKVPPKINRRKVRTKDGHGLGFTISSP